MGQARRTSLKLAVLAKYPSQRDFLNALSNGTGGIQISESRFSKLITGHLSPRPEEIRAICWKLQRPASEVFAGGGR